MTQKNTLLVVGLITLFTASINAAELSPSVSSEQQFISPEHAQQLRQLEVDKEQYARDLKAFQEKYPINPTTPEAIKEFKVNKGKLLLQGMILRKAAGSIRTSDLIK